DQNVFFDFEKKSQAQKLVVQGDYQRKSRYVRVELSTKLKKDEVPKDSLPVGFRGFDHLITSGTANLTTITGSTVSQSRSMLSPDFASDILKRTVEIPVPYRKTIKVGTGQSARKNSDLYWGVQFELPDNVDQPNKTVRKNNSIKAFVKHFPNHQTTWMNFRTGSNAGQASSPANSILDSDKFNNNLFSLENIQVVTASGNVADITVAKDWKYVRNGEITANEDNKTRAFDASKDLNTPERRSLFKYSTFMQGGFDGLNIFNEEMENLSDTSLREENDNSNRNPTDGPSVSAYKKAISIMKNKSDVDIKLLAIPGVRHPNITDDAIEAVKNRFDALYIMDVEDKDNLDNFVTSSAKQVHSVKNTAAAFKARSLNNSFAAAYYPNLLIHDADVGNVEVPPSVGVLGAYALNDKIGHPWFAPAGKARGKLEGALEAVVNLSKENLDTLYDADINPIVARPGDEGPIVWGQKTLQTKKTILDRVSVRRLLIEVRRQARDVANKLLFEPNRASTLAKFTSAMEPKLELIKRQSGLVRSKVVVDT
ncbi:MAG: phage tail sheath subtilisin-like domain-containing protein, partial [Nanoarchaeota archaeon]